ncbi:MAG: DUF4230 domain-containing protein [Oscillospiraceae bacterium]|nr:DUF4230 domain-containing protein [Oscillospiraceae bacterium]
MIRRFTLLTIKVKRLIIIVCAIVAVIALIFATHVVRDWFGNLAMQTQPRVTTDSALLEASVRQVAQLATLTLRYTEAGVEEDQRFVSILGWETAIPGTTRRMIVRWQGDIFFGINAEEIAIDIVDGEEDTSEVRVTLPDAVILSHAIDLSSVEVLDETTGIFARHSLSDLSTFLDARHQYINTRAETVVMLQTAQENAQDSIYQFLRLVLDDELYTIAFV